MPQIGANFQFTSRQPNFERDQFDTIAHMAACTVCDEGHKCYCLENQKTYEFTSVDSNGVAIEPNETTGYWHEFSSGGSGDVTGATIGSGASEQNVTKVGSILKFPAYPTVPITGIKDANGNDLTPVGGKVTLPAAATAPITKIKVDGASEDLPINEGRVVIPSPPVKGIQTSNGTTLNPDSNTGIVTLPAIPADPNTRLNNAEKRLTALESELGGDPTPVVIPVSAINLPHTSGSTFTYDPDDTYVMNISDVQISTVCYPYDHISGNTTTSYLVFKAIDRDLYYVYSHNLSTDLCTYFEEKVFDELSHAEAKAVFEAGKYAVKQVIDVNNNGNPRPLGYWKHGIPNVFVTPHGYPLRYNQIKENNVYYILLKCDEVNKIFKYSANNNKWSLVSGGCYTKNHLTTGENYEKYDAYFDRQPASNVSFDDSVTQLGTQGNPINNVQTAIQLLATKIYGYSSTLIITLTYNNGIRVANTVVNISAIFQGNDYDFSSQLNDPDNAQYVTTVDNVKKFKTNSSGECRIGLPIGATYELTFNNIANYIKPEPITGITDSTQNIIGASYQAISDYETVILKVVVHGVSGGVTPSGKKVYIDTYNSSNTSVVDVEGLYEITVNANGNPSTVKIKEGSSYTAVTDNVIKIDKGILYKVRLDNWDDTGIYTTSTSPLFKAQKVNRGVTLAYTYTLSGTYLLLKDLESEDGYKNYRIIEIDSTNNKIKIAREINGVTNNYWIYNNSNNVYIYEESQDVSTAYAWFEGINVDANNPIIGIGFRTQLLNNPSSSSRAVSGTCAFCVIPYNTTTIAVGALRESGANNAANSYIDGLANEESWLEIESPTSVITKTIHAITASIGNNTYNAFLPAYRQLEIIIQNIDNINLIFSIFNKNLVIATNTASGSNLWSSTLGNLVNYNATGLAANGYNKNMSVVGSSNSGFATNSYRSIPVFPY